MANFNSGVCFNDKQNAIFNSGPYTLTITDSGLGLDSVAYLSISLSITDTGAGVENISINTSLVLKDGHQSTQTAVGIGDVFDPSLDTGLGQDTITLDATANIADSGTGIESITLPSIDIPVSDSGSGSDIISIIASLALADSGAGADSADITATFAVLDDGSGNEEAILAVDIPITDSGEGIDIPSIAKTFFFVDENNVLQPLGVSILRGKNIDLMPEIRTTEEEIPGRHGEIYFDSKLGARIIELPVLANNITPSEREALKRTLAQYLNSAQGVKPLVFSDDIEKQYEVKYAGKIGLEQFPTWMKFTISLKAVSPYIQGSFEQVHVGDGTLSNVGNFETPLTIEIDGPVTNPSVTVGEDALSYTGIIAEGSKLIIDVEMLTVELDGVNVLANYSGGFPWLPEGNTTVTGASAGTTTFKWRGRWL